MLKKTKRLFLQCQCFMDSICVSLHMGKLEPERRLQWKELLGVNYRTLKELFRVSKERSDIMKYQLFVSMLEVYNEKIKDLLVEDTDHPAKKVLGLNWCEAIEAAQRSRRSTRWKHNLSLGWDRSKRLHNQCNGMFSSWYNYCRRSETLQRHCGSIGELYRNVKLMVLGLGLSVRCHWTTESWWHQASIFPQRKRFYFVGTLLKWDIRENGLTIAYLLLLRTGFMLMFSIWSWCRWVYDEHRSWALYLFMKAHKRKLWPAVFSEAQLTSQITGSMLVMKAQTGEFRMQWKARTWVQTMQSKAQAGSSWCFVKAHTWVKTLQHKLP
ncbi:uncharacterized protein LOC110920655 isoform X2 [Helianthus annuus]|uniref:uncharacterized protein LOC110920655 isoform X2 n=1 Tax=Helianthus annuus TaxID=4232 RepID=UPI000B8F330C|nr:uncharacterized protein LOC110920655 isoform X2 [Helianthus annuus]